MDYLICLYKSVFIIAVKSNVVLRLITRYRSENMMFNNNIIKLFVVGLSLFLGLGFD